MTALPHAPTALTPTALTPRELDALRAALTDDRAQRVEQRRLLGSGPDLLDPVVGAQAQALDDLLREVDAALARLDDGTYGTCRHCGDAIPYARLELVPHAGGCVRCLSALKGR